MRFKKLMLVTLLLLAILTIGAVSASDDVLAVEDSQEDSLDAPIEESIASDDAEDVLSYEASDFNVEINESMDLKYQDAAAVTFEVPDDAEGNILVGVNRTDSRYLFELDSSPIPLEDLWIEEPGKYSIYVFFRSTDYEEISLANATVNVISSINADDFDINYLYNDEEDPIIYLSDDILWLYDSPASGNLMVFVDGSIAYNVSVSRDDNIYITSEDLGIDGEKDAYNIVAKFKTADGHEFLLENVTAYYGEPAGPNDDEPVNTDYNITFGEYHYFNQEVVKGRGTYDASFEFPLSAEGNVTVYVDDEYYCVKDVDLGDVFLEINTTNLTLGKHDVRFVYSGDGRFKSSTAQDSFNVTHIRFEVPYVLMPDAMGMSAYAALTVLPFDATGEVKLIVDGIEMASEAIDEGSVIYYLPNYLTYGNHTVTLAYQNGNYLSASKKFSVENLIENDATVSFNATSGEGAMADVVVVKNTNFTLPECGFAKEGRVFYGWNVEGDAKYPGENITVTGDTAIRTIWRYDVDVGSSGISILFLAEDLSTTSVVGILTLTDTSTGKAVTTNVTVGPVQSMFTRPADNSTDDLIDDAVAQLLSIAQTQSSGKTVTVKNQTVSNFTAVARDDSRVYDTAEYYEGIDGIPIGSIPLITLMIATGNYSSTWVRNVSLEAEYASKTLTNIADVTLSLSKTAFTYNGKVQKPTVTLTNGTVLKEGVDYTLGWSAASPKNVGTYTVTVTGIGDYNGTAKATFNINKAANPLAVKAKTVNVKFSAVKKKAQTLAVSKVVTFTKKGQGTLTYVKSSGNKKITINKKTGKDTVAKGLKKGTYSVKVKIKAAGNANYKASAYKTVTFKVVIK